MVHPQCNLVEVLAVGAVVVILATMDGNRLARRLENKAINNYQEHPRGLLRKPPLLVQVRNLKLQTYMSLIYLDVTVTV